MKEKKLNIQDKVHPIKDAANLKELERH